jgi:hypothetical protein
MSVAAALALLPSKTNSGFLYRSWLTLSSTSSAQIEGAGCELGVQRVFRQQAVVLLGPARDPIASRERPVQRAQTAVLR